MRDPRDPRTRKPRWVVVLSGGEGERLKAMTQKWLGVHRPKQYCAFVGSRTMLEHTLDRARVAVGPERIVTVIGRGHRAFVDPSNMPGKVIEQPANLDTATGLLLGLSYIEAMEPDATVTVFPSDHFISPEGRFLQHVERSAILAERLSDRLVLLGAHSDRPETEFGWIEPGQSATSWGWSARQVPHDVTSFREKPSEREARDFYARGFLWNTMIMSAKAAVYHELTEKCIPDVAAQLQGARELWAGPEPPDEEQEALTLLGIYRGLRRSNFSREVLQLCPNRTVVLPMAGVEWNDWGRPERIGETLRRLSKRALIPLELLTSTG
jgi:mannose-1-phosphate guanylyltransferase